MKRLLQNEQLRPTERRDAYFHWEPLKCMNHESNCPLSPNYQGGWAASVPPTCSCHKSAEKWKCIEHKGQPGNAYLDCEFCKPATDTAEKCDCCPGGMQGWQHTRLCAANKPKPTTDTGDWRERFHDYYFDKNNYKDFATLKAFIAKEISHAENVMAMLAAKSNFERYKQGVEAGRAAVEAERPIYYPSREAFTEAMKQVEAAERARVRDQLAAVKTPPQWDEQSWSEAKSDLLETLKD